MDCEDTPEEAALRFEVRSWLADHVGPYRAAADEGGAASLLFADASDPDHVERGKAWQRELFDAGWAGLGWPAEYGGRDLPVAQRLIWAQEAAAAGVPPGINLIGEAIAGPTLMAHGTEEQKRRWLPPILRADEIWCQLFSEPGAGSDLAAVTTTAVRNGDGFVVDGHKVWTSAAHYADFGVLLARTDWEVPKHRGCSYFVVDMNAEGVSARPMRQMTGGAAFDEVVLEAVRVPAANLVGAEGEGWAVAVTTLMNERLNIGLGLARVGGGLDRLLGELRERGVADDPVIRQMAADLYIDTKCLQYLGYRAVSKLANGEVPGPEGSVAKLASARVSRKTDELLDAMRGPGAMVHDAWTELQLWVPASSIAGGTDEVLKNIIAERVLGLPREPDPCRDLPFSEVAGRFPGGTGPPKS